MPVTSEVNPGATTFSYKQYDSVGSARLISAYATDLPRADVVAKEFSGIVRTIGNSFGYSTQEVRSSAFAGTNLESRKSAAATRAHQELVNKIAFSGDADHGLPGLLTNPNLPEVTLLADGTGSSKTWATKTADKIVRDVGTLIDKIIVQSKGIHMATEVWMPISQFALISRTQNSVASDTTILEFLRGVYPGVTFRGVVEMAGAGSGGTDMILALENSVENYALELPMMQRFYAPQMTGLEWVIPCESRICGTQVYYPLAFAFASGL
jgi:hypothetical protein